MRVQPFAYTLAPMSKVAVRLFSHSVERHMLVAELTIEILPIASPQLSGSAPLSLPCSCQHNRGIGLLHDILDYVDQLVVNTQATRWSPRLILLAEVVAYSVNVQKDYLHARLFLRQLIASEIRRQ